MAQSPGSGKWDNDSDEGRSDEELPPLTPEGGRDSPEAKGRTDFGFAFGTRRCKFDEMLADGRITEIPGGKCRGTLSMNAGCADCGHIICKPCWEASGNICRLPVNPCQRILCEVMRTEQELGICFTGALREWH